MKRDLPIDATGGPCYPTERYEPPDGWHFEVMPLTLGRGRIIATDGTSVAEFW